MIPVPEHIYTAALASGLDAVTWAAGHASLLASIGITASDFISQFNKTREKMLAKQHSVSTGSKRALAYGDDNLISNQKRMNPLVTRIGHSINNVDSVGKFLRQLCGSGKISTCWSGEMSSDIGKRSYHYEFFRHRLAADTANVNSAPYPVTTPGGSINTPEIFMPISTARQLDTASLANYPYQFVDGRCYFAPLNRADYEDMSWNLNKLKLGNVVYNNSTAPIDDYTIPQHPLMQVNQHRKQSSLQQNNAYCASLYTSANRMTEQPYIYDMHFKSGTVDYEFMNKGNAGAVIDVVVYRIKKGHQPPTSVVPFQDSPSPQTYMSNWTNTLGQGYIQSATNRFGTDDLAGRNPVSDDILTNPDHVFLKHTSKVKAADVPFAEVSRHSVCLPAGGRRMFTVELPGDVYNPCDIPRVVYGQNTTPDVVTPATLAIADYTPDSTNGYPWDYDSDTVCLLDTHSYVICMATSGEKLSRIVSKNVPTVTPSSSTPNNCVCLDEYVPALVQYYCRYTERIGSAVYSDKQNQKLFVRGERGDFAFTQTGTDYSVDAGMILELSKTVQQANNVFQAYTTGGTFNGSSIQAGGNIAKADRTVN